MHISCQNELELSQEKLTLECPFLGNTVHLYTKCLFRYCGLSEEAFKQCTQNKKFILVQHIVISFLENSKINTAI